MDEMNHTREGDKILSLNNAVPRNNETPVVPACDEAEVDSRQALDELFRIMWEEGMDPVVQLAGYLVTEDPTYLPAQHHARGLARRVGRDKLLRALIEQYIGTHTPPETPPKRGEKD